MGCKLLFNMPLCIISRVSLVVILFCALNSSPSPPLPSPSPLQVSVEMERVLQGGRLLHLLLPPSSPPLSGFRLDAPPLDRSSGMYPSACAAGFSGPLSRAAEGGLVDEWAVLGRPFRLRVSARKVSTEHCSGG